MEALPERQGRCRRLRRSHPASSSSSSLTVRGVDAPAYSRPPSAGGGEDQQSGGGEHPRQQQQQQQSRRRRRRRGVAVVAVVVEEEEQLLPRAKQRPQPRPRPRRSGASRSSSATRTFGWTPRRAFLWPGGGDARRAASAGPDFTEPGRAPPRLAAADARDRGGQLRAGPGVQTPTTHRLGGTRSC